MTEDLDPRDDRAPTRLRLLARRPAAPVGWSPPDTVRRAVVIRRRRRWSITAGVVVVVAVATALSLTNGSGGSAQRPAERLPGSVHVGDRIGGAVQLVANTAPVGPVAGSAVDGVVAAEQKLTLALLQQLSTGANVSVSPASLYIALGMLQNAARGQTAAQISAALQASGLSTADQNAGLAGLAAQLNAAAVHDGITLDSANSLWQQHGFAVRPAFLRALAAYYRTGVWQVDYAHDMPAALKAIDEWTARQTHGKITKLFDHLDPTTVLVLANAIYFHAAWQTPFDKARTEPGQFTTAGGQHVQAQFMSGGAGLTTAATDTYGAVQLPYRGGRFAALAIMPRSGSLADFVASLTPDLIDRVVAGLGPTAGVALPRFTTASKLDLKPALKALGMVMPFSDSADLSGLSAQIATKVDQVIQRVYLGVGEKGTTAAAATGISIMPTMAMQRPLTFDHPFLFLVRDTVTGAILFASEVQDPTAG